MRAIISVLMICVAHIVCAQIQIIPRDKVLDAANPTIVTSSVSFSVEVVDFGTIDEMSGVWKGSAKLVNKGRDTVAVTRIKSTCGCLQADMPRRVLLPNEAVEVTLKYYPRGHAGRVAQRVFIYTNEAENSLSAALQLKGVVTASADRADDYPYTRGALRLRQDRVLVEGATKETLRVACMNGGSTTLHLGVDTLLTTKGLKVRFEPSQLAPKQEGDMVVEFTPTTNSETEVVGRIFMKGLNLPPRQSVVEVVKKN